MFGHDMRLVSNERLLRRNKEIEAVPSNSSPPLDFHCIRLKASRMLHKQGWSNQRMYLTDLLP